MPTSSNNSAGEEPTLCSGAEDRYRGVPGIGMSYVAAIGPVPGIWVVIVLGLKVPMLEGELKA